MPRLFPALIIIMAAGWASSAWAERSDYQMGFGPFIGGGSISNGATVRHTSGYSLSLERNWRLSDSVSIGPHFEVANAFINTRERTANTKNIATYDNRTLAAGLTVSHTLGNDATLAQGAYVTAVAGRSYSKLSVDESSEQSFVQSIYGGISGNYFAGELGAWIPLKGNFGINLAFLSSVYKADQSTASGTYEGDRLENGSLSLLKGQHDAADGSLDSSVTIKTYGARMGLSLGF